MPSAQDAATGGASRPGKGLASVQLDPAHTVRSARAEAAHDEADLASELIASGVTTQSVDTVIAVLSAHHAGASINAAAKASGINYRTAQRIVEVRPSVDTGGSKTPAEKRANAYSRSGIVELTVRR